MKALIFTMILSLPLMAGAHTLWDVPAPRNTNDNVKVGPCGPQGVLANVKPPAANPANVFLEGQTIDISWFETINHTGYFWVDLALADAALLEYNPNDPNPLNNNRATVWRLSPAPPANFIDDNVVSGFKYERQVTLPAGVSCENCTMRLVQFMEGRVQPYYYSCADVKIMSAREAAIASGSAFATTVHPVLRTDCAGCHDVNGAANLPHAVSDAFTSHKFVIENNFVDLADPANSMMINLIRAGHGGNVVNPIALADQLQAQVTAWLQGGGKFIGSVSVDDIPANTAEANSGGNGGGGENSSSSVSENSTSQSQFGGCGSISGGGGPGGPISMAFLLFLLLPLAAVYAGKMSPITVRR